MKRFSFPYAVLILTALSTLALAAEDYNITVFRPSVNQRDKTDPFVQAMDQYTKQYGGKVTLVRADWNSWVPKIIMRLAAGDPIDVIFAGCQNFPQFYTKGYLQPIESYVDLNVDNVKKALPAMDQVFKFDGKYFLAGNYTYSQPWMVIYNKTLMDENGIDVGRQPLALYKAGKWNWANFRDIAKKLTADLDGDGKMDHWGVNTWDHFCWLYENGTSLTMVDARGQGKLNFDDPRVLEALTAAKQAIDEGWYNPNNDENCLQNRKAAMYLERCWYPPLIQKKTGDEIVAVPLPVGPSNKDGRFFFMLDGYGIGAGSKKQAAAGKFIDICLASWYKYDLAKEAAYNQQENELLAEMRRKTFYPEGTESLLESIKSDFIGQVIWGGIDPA
jgi:multiple sugar transport system substrate-binding protein